MTACVDASLQQIDAPKGQAVGQCPRCGTFRSDGRPPTVHRHGCTEGPDGSQLGPLLPLRYGDPRRTHVPLYLGNLEEEPGA
jgi:hypothetical protein